MYHDSRNNLLDSIKKKKPQEIGETLQQLKTLLKTRTGEIEDEELVSFAIGQLEYLKIRESMG